MKKSRLLGAVCACVLTISYFNCQATIITYGNLTSDDSTNYITDTVTNRLYSRFDAFSLSYADTVAATQPGGAWEGWSVADSMVADDFVNALFGSTTPCNGAVAYGTDCGTLSGWVDDAFGTSYTMIADYFYYVSTFDTPGNIEQEVGILRILDSGSVRDFDGWESFAFSDSYSTSASPIDFLLYKDAAVVPLPAAAWLFSSVLLGLVGIARCKVS